MGGRRGQGRGPGGKPKNVKKTLGRLLGYISGEKLKLFIVFLCVIGGTAANLAGSYMLRPIINGLTDENGSVATLLRGILMMAAIYVSGVLAQFLQQRIMIGISQNAIFRLRNELYGKMQKLPVRYYDTNNHGDVMSRFTNDVDVVGEMLNNTVVQLISGTINIIGTFALMVYTNVWLTLITVFMIPVMLKAVQAVGSRSRKYYSAQQAAIGTLNGYIEETVTGQKVVKVFNHEDDAREEFEYLNRDLRGKQIKAQFFGGIMGPVMGNLSQVSYSLTACIGGILCVLRGFDLGGLTVFVNYSRQFSRPINEVAMQVNTIFSALAGADLRYLFSVPAITAILLAVLSFFCMGLTLSAVMLHTRDTYLTQNTLFIAMNLVCGIMYPIQYLPESLQRAAQIFPLTPAVSLFRNVVIEHQSLMGNAGLIQQIVLLSGVYLMIGTVWYKRMEPRLLESVFG